MRLLALEAAPVLGRLFDHDMNARFVCLFIYLLLLNHCRSVLPGVKMCSADKSWRVRFMVAEQICPIAQCFSQQVCFDLFLVFFLFVFVRLFPPFFCFFLVLFLSAFRNIFVSQQIPLFLSLSLLVLFQIACPNMLFAFFFLCSPSLSNSSHRLSTVNLCPFLCVC